MYKKNEIFLFFYFVSLIWWRNSNRPVAALSSCALYSWPIQCVSREAITCAVCNSVWFSESKRWMLTMLLKRFSHIQGSLLFTDAVYQGVFAAAAIFRLFILHTRHMRMHNINSINHFHKHNLVAYFYFIKKHFFFVLKWKFLLRLQPYHFVAPFSLTGAIKMPGVFFSFSFV